jgi:hypothetical protein
MKIDFLNLIMSDCHLKGKLCTTLSQTFLCRSIAHHRVPKTLGDALNEKFILAAAAAAARLRSDEREQKLK